MTSRAAMSRVLCIALVFGACAGSEDQSPISPGREGVVTLYAFDEMQSTFGFVSNSFGYANINGRYHNKTSHIGYHRWRANSLTVAIEGSDSASVRDIGDPRDYDHNVSIFHSIAWTGVKFDLSEVGYSKTKSRVSMELPEPTASTLSFDVNIGHIYIARLVTTMNSQRIHIPLVLRVLSSIPGQSVTFRWRYL